MAFRDLIIQLDAPKGIYQSNQIQTSRQGEEPPRLGFRLAL